MDSSKRDLDYLINGTFDDTEYYQAELEEKRKAIEKVKQEEQEFQQKISKYFSTLPQDLKLNRLTTMEKSAILVWQELDIPITKILRFGRSNNRGELFINEAHQRWSYVGEPFFVRNIYHFSDIVDCRLNEEFDQSIQQHEQGRAGSALVGGLLFGTTGAVVGAARGRNINGTSKEVCRSLSVQFILANTESPSLTMHMICFPVHTSSPEYLDAKNDATSIVGSFLSLKALAEKTLASSDKKKPADPLDFADMLEKLFALKEKGIITEEEFILKKKQILNI